jgi:acyl-CoA thioester hydrolase
VRLAAEPTVHVADYAFVHRLRVRFAETDAMGIVHHANHLLYLEEARVAYLRHLERPYSEMRADGVDHAVLEAFVQYRRPIHFDDVVEVHLRLASVTRATFQLAYLLTVEGEPRATAVTVHGCVDARGRAVRMPEWLAGLATDERGAAG